MIVYAAKQNSDLTEGWGRMETFATFINLSDAVKAVQDRGVMGVGTGEVYQEEIYSSLDEWQDAKRNKSNMVYGYRKNLKGQFGYGYVDNRDQSDLIADPDYQEMLRLQRKFGVSL